MFVYLPDGRPTLTEKDYNGYGVFGGRDFYGLVVEINGIAKPRKGKHREFDEKWRGLGIKLSHDTYLSRAGFSTRQLAAITRAFKLGIKKPRLAREAWWLWELLPDSDDCPHQGMPPSRTIERAARSDLASVVGYGQTCAALMDELHQDGNRRYNTLYGEATAQSRGFVEVNSAVAFLAAQADRELSYAWGTGHRGFVGDIERMCKGLCEWVVDANEFPDSEEVAYDAWQYIKSRYIHV